MNLYLTVKTLHVISATILFGTGLGTAFFMLRAWLGGSQEVMKSTAASVVYADWFFTTPAVVMQLATGLWLTSQLGISWGSLWFVLVVTLFAAVGLCWLPVVWIQIVVRDRLLRGAGVDECRPLMRLWFVLGVPAFLAVLVLFWLMVFKPWTAVTLFAAG